MMTRSHSGWLSCVVAMLGVVAGCAAPSGSMPREARPACIPPEQWICEDRWPSRIKNSDRLEEKTFCRCERIERVR